MLCWDLDFTRRFRNLNFSRSIGPALLFSTGNLSIDSEVISLFKSLTDGLLTVLKFLDKLFPLKSYYFSFITKNYNELKYHRSNYSNNNKIIIVFLLKLVDDAITLESSVSDIKAVLMYHDLNFIKSLRIEEISVDWIN